MGSVLTRDAGDECNLFVQFRQFLKTAPLTSAKRSRTQKSNNP
jgi:hypothetical protein